MQDTTSTGDGGRVQREQHNHLVIGRCIRWYRTESADLTVEGRAYLWRNLAGWLEDHHKTTIDRATYDQLQDWRDSQSCARRTLASRISGVHVFYYWLVEIAEARLDDPSRKLKRPRRVKRDSGVVEKAMSEREFFTALEAAAHNLELFALLMLGRFCGLRRVEMSRLRVCDIEERHNGGAWLAVLGKGDVWRRVPCPPEVYRTLTPFARGSGYVFTHHTGRAYRPREIGDKVNSHLKALGIGHVLHDTRHSCATRMLELTGNLREVQELLGHASLDTTAIYTAVEPRQLAEVVDLVTRHSIEQQAAVVDGGVRRTS